MHEGKDKAQAGSELDKTDRTHTRRGRDGKQSGFGAATTAKPREKGAARRSTRRSTPPSRSLPELRVSPARDATCGQQDEQQQQQEEAAGHEAAGGIGGLPAAAPRRSPLRTPHRQSPQRLLRQHGSRYPSQRRRGRRGRCEPRKGRWRPHCLWPVPCYSARLPAGISGERQEKGIGFHIRKPLIVRPPGYTQLTPIH